VYTTITLQKHQTAVVGERENSALKRSLVSFNQFHNQLSDKFSFDILLEFYIDCTSVAVYLINKQE